MLLGQSDGVFIGCISYYYGRMIYRALFIVLFSLLFCGSSFSQSHSQFFDYIGFNAYWNGTTWTSYASGYSNILTTNTSTGDFTLYTGGNAASAGLTRTLAPVVSMSSSGSVSATSFVGYTGSFGNVNATGTISTAALTVNGVAITGNGSGGGGSTSSTMVEGWPDAIMCTATNPAWGILTFYQTAISSANDRIYRFIASDADYQIVFSSTGVFKAYGNMTASSCDNKSIAQLYASGQAFNFVGNSGANGTDGTDNITSGTTKVTANSTGYISLTTGGTTTGYFDTAGRLVVPGISTTGPLNATSIRSAGSVTYGAYSSEPVACSASYKGMVAMSNTLENLCLCTGTRWVSVGSGGTACTW